MELEELISIYKIASVQDLYSAADLSCPYTYNNYGWTEVQKLSGQEMMTDITLNCRKHYLLTDKEKQYVRM